MTQTNKRYFIDGKALSAGNLETVSKLRKNARRVTDEEYTIILDIIVVNCVDAALISPDGKILMARRHNEPYKNGWAFPGGRQIPGESYGDTAARHTLKNTGLTVDPARFQFVRSDSWLWSLREQPPQDRGCHMNGVTVVTTLTLEEVARVRSDDDIFKPEWMTLQEVSASDEIHPSHRNAASDIQDGRMDQLS